MWAHLEGGVWVEEFTNDVIAQPNIDLLGAFSAALQGQQPEILPWQGCCIGVPRMHVVVLNPGGKGVIHTVNESFKEKNGFLIPRGNIEFLLTGQGAKGEYEHQKDALHLSRLSGTPRVL